MRNEVGTCISKFLEPSFKFYFRFILKFCTSSDFLPSRGWWFSFDRGTILFSLSRRNVCRASRWNIFFHSQFISQFSLHCSFVRWKRMLFLAGSLSANGKLPLEVQIRFEIYYSRVDCCLWRNCCDREGGMFG